MNRLRSERGIALVAAIVALVLVGGMVAGSMFIALQEQRVGRNVVRQQQAFWAAETAALEPVTVWGASAYRDLAVGGTATATGTTTTGWYRYTVRRLNHVLYLSQADGFSWDLASRQRVAMLLRLRPLPLNIDAALKTLDPPSLGGSSDVTGADVQPANWTACPAPGPAMPAVWVPGPGGPPGCGLPCLLGDLPFDSLRSYATKAVHVAGRAAIVRPSQSGATCHTGDPYNWGDPGDPSGACGSYFPAIWVESDLSLDGLRGQGVLMVNGDLTLGGGFEFVGPVLVRGTLRTFGMGARITGGVIAGAVFLDQSGVLGRTVIQFSSCAVSRALTGSAVLVPLVERGWTELY